MTSLMESELELKAMASLQNLLERCSPYHELFRVLRRIKWVEEQQGACSWMFPKDPTEVLGSNQVSIVIPAEG